MRVYGSDICKDCRSFKEVVKQRSLPVEFIDITENTPNLRAFLQLRDSHSAFDEVRAAGRIGIPVFEGDDGRITLDANEALLWMGEEPMAMEESGCASCG